MSIDLTIEEYEARAKPRLAAIDALAARCAWEKFDFQCTPEELRAREHYTQLMREQGEDEVRAGL